MQSMIAHLRGRLLGKHPNQAIVDVGGVGYEVTITVPTFSELAEAGQEVALHIHTHVREDQIALFGFLRAEEKRLFEKLITVSGIGPKLAITILSGMPVGELIGAIRGADVARLTKTPGIGKKTAERMVLELREKLEELRAAAVAAPALSPVADDVLSALVNLGYQRPLAEKAVEKAAGSPADAASTPAGMKADAQKTFDQVFREALKLLTR
jgi:holliday junction DNA helicase RuvA